MHYYKMLIFLGVFILSSTLLYIITPKKYRYITLLITSIGFYIAFSTFGAIFLVTTILLSFYAGVWIDKIGSNVDLKSIDKPLRKQIKKKIKRKKKAVLILYIVLNIGILAVLKYFNFFSESFSSLLDSIGIENKPLAIKIILPLGISYYSLSSLGYVIDVFRGKFKHERNILKLGLFISFFPHLYEGPFARYDELIDDMTNGENIKSEDAFDGVLLILWGVFQIFMIANRASIIADQIFKNPNSYSGFVIILGTVFYIVQLFAEFSGYVDIARGSAKIFGITLARNFDKPFLSQNVSEFWRRWHISLGSWFRDYIFYPISFSKGLSKMGKKWNRKVKDFVTVTIALAVVWFLTGLWHGASYKYIVYGLYYFGLMVLYNLLSPLYSLILRKIKVEESNKILISIRIAKTFILVLIGIMMFRASDLGVFKDMFISIFDSSKASIKFFDLLSVKDFVVLIISLIFLISIALVRGKENKVISKFYSMNNFQKYAICFVFAILIIIFGAYGNGYTPPDPVYGGF